MEDHLVKYIGQASYAVGCACWLTNRNIIDALERMRGVKIIVSKEEFLNPKMQSAQRFSYSCIRGCYNALSDLSKAMCTCCPEPTVASLCPNYRHTFGTRMHDLPIDGAVLTCGIVNHGSRMHHKFLVFFDESFKPIGVWTGSYNFSRNSNHSLENALYVTEPRVIQEYIKEFLAIYLLAEKYDWTSSLMCDSRKSLAVSPISPVHPAA
ncbi:Hypothetical protein MVR_LOCUS27 [uncultured virus]|nr:Hypothetical protein MVR_LOCUS27 [uncultured virus]